MTFYFSNLIIIINIIIIFFWIFIFYIKDLKNGKNVLIVAHANSLRGLLKDIEGLDDMQISNVSIPNGIPLVYEFDRKMNIIPQNNSILPLNGKYLEKKG